MYHEWTPPPGWCHAVACLWGQQVTGRRVQRVLPDGHADLLFYESGELNIVGLADSVALPELPAGTVIWGLRFRPEAVGAAFQVPASTLRNLTVPAADVLGAGPAHRLVDPTRLDEWVRAIQPNRRVAAATMLLDAHPVEQVADLLSVTSRHLRRVLLEEVGLAPKKFQQVLRLQRFVRAADRGTALAAAAADAGYADQAHLTREVRRLSGLTPAHLVNQRRAQPQA